MRNIQKLVYLSLLCSLSLVIYIIELQIPPLVPIPGVRLGLANMVTLAVLILYGYKEAFSVLFIRILLGSFLTGQMSALLFSLSGGILSTLGMTLLYTLFKDHISIWLVSICGALLHTFAQVTVAVLITETVGIYWYIPFLALSSIISGYFVGLGTNFICTHFSRLQK